MKAIVRKIDDAGRIILPKDIRRTLGLIDGSPLEIITTNEGILLKKHITGLDLIADLENLQRSVKEERLVVGQDKVEQVQRCLQEALLLLRQAN
jgi:transcriptional pleiotropic regulator of transition state genes